MRMSIGDYYRVSHEPQSFIAGCVIHSPGIRQVALLDHCIVISADRSFTSGERYTRGIRPVSSSHRQQCEIWPVEFALLISASAVLLMVMTSALSLMKQSRAIKIGAVDKIHRAEPVSLSPKRKRNEYVFIIS